MDAKESYYTYKLHDESKRVGGGYPLSEEGGPALEAKIEEVIKRHYPALYFQEQEDGRILIFRSEDEATDAANTVGEVFPVA